MQLKNAVSKPLQETLSIGKLIDEERQERAAKDEELSFSKVEEESLATGQLSMKSESLLRDDASSSKK